MGFIPQEAPKNQPFGYFYIFILYKMEKLEGLQNYLEKEYIIDKGFIENHYKKQFNQLKKMFGDDWYLGKYRTVYYLVVGECETSFVSMKLDFASIVDGIEFGILANKHVKK